MENFISTLTIVVLILVVFLILKRKKNQSQPPKTYLGCTLPALLFIIFVPIILLGIGYIAYQGMAKSQMSYDTKTIHARTIKYISAEVQRCRHGETSIMDNTLSCSEITTNKIASAVTSISADLNPYYGWKTGLLAVRISTSNTNDKDVGFINLSPSGSDIIIKSCHKTPCRQKENRLQANVSIN